MNECSCNCFTGWALALLCLFLVGCQAARESAEVEPEQTAVEHALPAPPQVWFENLGAPSAWSLAQLERAVETAYAALRRPEPAFDADFAFLPEDSEPRMVFLSWSDGRRPVRVVHAGGRGWAKALSAALDEARQQGADRNSVEFLKLDLVQHVALFPEWQADRHPIPDPSLRGVALAAAAPFAFLPEQIMFNRMYTASGLLDAVRISQLLLPTHSLVELGLFKKVIEYSGEQPLFSFDTQSVFFDGRQALPVYRGHALAEPPTRQDLRRAADRLVDFLVRNIESDGSIDSDPEIWTTHTEHGFHSLRIQTAVLWGLTRYAALTGDQAALSAARRLAEQLRGRAQPLVAAGNVEALVEFVEADLETNSYGVLAWLDLANLTGRTEDREFALRLARFLRLQLQPTGQFLPRRYVPGAQIATEVEVDSSALAAIALVRLYEATGQPAFFEAAEAAMDFLLHSQIEPVEMTELPGSPWFLAAANALFTHNRDQRLSRQSERMVVALTAGQRLADSLFADLAGSYRDHRTTARVAALAPGLAEAIRLLRDRRRETAAASLRSNLQLNLVFQMQAQFGRPELLYVPHPTRLAGAFRDDIRGISVSLDAQAYQLLALVSVLELMEEEGLEQLPLSEEHKAGLHEARRAFRRFARGLPPSD